MNELKKLSENAQSLSDISLRERFIAKKGSFGRMFAPLSLGTPAFTNYPDRRIFKKTRAEKEEAKAIVKTHKKMLLDKYGKGKIGKRLNVIPDFIPGPYFIRSSKLTEVKD